MNLRIDELERRAYIEDRQNELALLHEFEDALEFTDLDPQDFFYNLAPAMWSQS